MYRPRSEGIKKVLVPKLLNSPVKIDACILLWDSDISDFHEEELSTSERNKRRHKYQSDLSSLVKSITKAGIQLIISGPGYDS